MGSLCSREGVLMITKIELKNFQSHKNTVLEFDKGINVICGETDNGKSAVIRAIRWVVENSPSGTNLINSRWNKEFKEPLSVRLYTENGYVERIRDNKRNGYDLYRNGEEVQKLDAIGKNNVPKEVTDFLNVSDVNFQYQLDPPYLISKTPGEASKYLNELVHLDCIDNIMSLSDSDKRQLSSEQKIVEQDIKKYEEESKKYDWVDKADSLYLRTSKLLELCNEFDSKICELNDSIVDYESYSIVDVTEHKSLIKEIEDINIPDYTELENSLQLYVNLDDKIQDMDKYKKLVNEIDSIIITDVMELENSILQFEELSKDILQCEKDKQELKDRIPNICPLCGNTLNKEQLDVC